MKPHPHSSLSARIAAAALACLAPTPLHAADRFWIDATGGPFSTTSNWSTTDGGAGGASVPGLADIANFTLNNTYTVTYSADVTNTNLDVDDGTVTFDLNGHTYTLTGSGGIDVATLSGQLGRLTIRDGTLAVDTAGDSVTLAVSTGSTGFLTVTTGGRIGDGTIRPDVNVGPNGSGTLTVNDNGRIDGRQLVIGSVTGGTGSATITGPNAVADFSSTTTVGGFGSGTLNVSNGGTLTSGATALIGEFLGGNGIATVSGAGSSWTTDLPFTIGSSGDGTLAISAGGLISSAAIVTLGNSSTGIGTVSVSGANSRWALETSCVVGSSGLGNLTISNGGWVTLANNAVLGSAAGGEGRVTVTGTGSLWSLDSSVNLGNSGRGDLMVSGGGEVSTTALTLGSQATGTGVVSVTGAGSKINVTFNTTVAGLGTGTLNVSAGAQAYFGADLTIGDPAGTPIGTVNLDGGSIYVGDDFLNDGVFSFTDGLLQVAGLFRPHASLATFTINGSDNGDLPTVDLRGSGGSINITTLIVGNTRRGQLLLRQSRLLNLGANNVDIGALAGSEGTIAVESGAELRTTGTLAVGGSGGTAGGAGTLSIAGGTVDVGTLALFPGGVIQLNGGTLQFNVTSFDGGTVNFNSGTIRESAATVVGSSSRFFETLLGPGKQLGLGRRLTFDTSLSYTGHTLTVDGGELNASTALTINAGSGLEMRAGRVTANTLTNNALLLLQGGDLILTSTLANSGEVRLDTANDSLVLSGTTLTNTGLIHGHGQINMALTNNSAGQVRAQAGERLVLNGASSNNGTGRIEVSAGGDLQFASMLANNATIDVIGGTLRVEGAAANAASTGFITARNAILRFNGGLTNSGRLQFSFGTSDIFGAITNNVTGRIIVSGNSEATFNGAVVNNGIIQVSTGSTAVYFGNVSGTGSYAGGGTNFYEGGFSPGASPALVTFDGDLAFGGSALLTLEIGGLVAGAEYDRLEIAGTLHPDGSLAVALLDDFTPHFGDAFDLFDAANIAGSFDTIDLPALGAGLEWDATNLQSTGEVRVVPEPGIGALLLTALALLGVRRPKGAALSRRRPSMLRASAPCIFRAANGRKVAAPRRRQTVGGWETAAP